MPISVLNGTYGTSPGGSSLAATSFPVTNGNALVVLGTLETAGATVTGVNLGGVEPFNAIHQFTASNGHQMFIAYLKEVTSATGTYNITVSTSVGAVDGVFVVWEVSGQDTTTFYDTHTTGTDQVSSRNITTGANNCAVFGWASSDAGEPNSWTAGFSAFDAPNMVSTYEYTAFDEDIGAAGVKSVSFGQSSWNVLASFFPDGYTPGGGSNVGAAMHYYREHVYK
jgi:hypothetical protein